MATTITKKQFDEVYGKHPPNGWIKFAFKYFSKDTEKKNLIVENAVVYFFIGMFFIGFIGTMLNMSRSFIFTTTLLYSIPLTILVLYLFSAIILNNMRINKIIKELGVTKDEYEVLVQKYY